MSETREMFRIHNRATGGVEGVYTRANYDWDEFPTAIEALNANCYGIHRDRGEFRIARYRVTIEELDPDVPWADDDPGLCR